MKNKLSVKWFLWNFTLFSPLGFILFNNKFFFVLKNFKGIFINNFRSILTQVFCITTDYIFMFGISLNTSKSSFHRVLKPTHYISTVCIHILRITRKISKLLNLYWNLKQILWLNIKNNNSYLKEKKKVDVLLNCINQKNT